MSTPRNRRAAGRSWIVSHTPKPTIIPSIALGELERGRDKGRSAHAGITSLIAAGYVTVIDLPEEAEDVYLSLVAGRASQTLDDGEAATLALALHLGATALIDERKAISIAAARFPLLTVATMASLLPAHSSTRISPATALRADG